MRMLVRLASASLAAGLMAGSAALAQPAPWPPPPGMTAGEYAARYGHRVRPDPYGGGPRHRERWDERSYHRRHDYGDYRPRRRPPPSYYYDDEED